MERFLHGRLASVGSQVFDAAYGAGTVVSLSAASAGITVRFSGGRTLSYTDNGHTPRFAQATLFWQNPVFNLPNNLTANQRRVVARSIDEMATALVEEFANV